MVRTVVVAGFLGLALAGGCYRRVITERIIDLTIACEFGASEELEILDPKILVVEPPPFEPEVEFKTVEMLTVYYCGSEPTTVEVICCGGEPPFELDLEGPAISLTLTIRPWIGIPLRNLPH